MSVAVGSTQTTVSSTTDSSTFDVSMPASISAGDLLVAIISADGAPDLLADVGWEWLGQDANGSAVTSATFYRTAAGSDTLSIFSTANEQYSSIVYRLTGTGTVDFTDITRGSLIWSDTFDRANATGVASVNNGWLVQDPYGAGGGNLNINSNRLQRVGSGSYFLSLNPAGGSLPSDVWVEMDFTGNPSTWSFFGLAARMPSSVSAGDDSGVKGFFADTSDIDGLEIGSGDQFDTRIVISADDTFPSSWTTNTQHTMTLAVVGRVAWVFIDGTQVAHGRYVAPSTGSNIGIAGDVGGGLEFVDEIRVYNVTAPAPVVDVASANGSSTNSNPPSLTPVGGSQEYLWIAARSGDSTTVATAAPSGYSSLLTRAGGGTSGASTNSAIKLATASTEDPGTFTSGDEQWVTWTISVAPAAGGGGGSLVIPVVAPQFRRRRMS